MESMSQYLMEYHSKELNLYGELENHLPEIYYFKNFVSSGITTINTLEEILINSPVHPISQSSYREKNIPNNVVFQFKKKGYQTIFITGGRLAWRNLENYLYKQDFEIVEGDKAIENAISGTSQSEWGIFDEFVFERAFNLLNIDTIKPKFVYIMTTTNHTPFKVPKTYKPYPVSMNESFKQKLKIDTALSKKELIAFQYANNCLGNFINKLRSSKPGENTIVVITGDHTRPNFFNFYNEEIYKNYAVPLLVFIPQKYKPDFEIDTNRFGSHKDIFPTIFNLALSKTTYLKSGNNLFTPLNDTTYFYGISNSNAGISKDGVYFADKNLFLSWKDTSYSRLIINPNLNLSDRLNNKIRAHSALMEIILKSELLKE
jgi:phosphoglycerol transferase MdoB-like AlkP superfamily enzyme